MFCVGVYVLWLFWYSYMYSYMYIVICIDRVNNMLNWLIIFSIFKFLILWIKILLNVWIILCKICDVLKNVFFF